MSALSINMPTFIPPLEQTTEVPVSLEANNFVHLSFQAIPDRDEEDDVSYQVWTDLPSVDHQGQLLDTIGSWTAIPFQRAHAEPFRAPAQGLTLEVARPPDATERTLFASVIVPALEGTYAYTFRRVRGADEVEWLGSGGSNGSIRLVQGAIPAETSVHGPFTGLAIELSE